MKITKGVATLKMLDKPIIRICPYCNYESNRVASHTSEPKCPTVTSGDFSICINCGGIGVFGPKMKLRKIELIELATMEHGEREFIIKMQQHIREDLL